MNENKIKQVFNRHLPNKEEIRMNIINRVSEETKPARSTWSLKKTVIACCAIVLVLSAFGGTAFAIEAKEYKEAVEFFNEYSLPAEGLTRSEIKEVYNDFEANNFTNEKTKDILQTITADMYSKNNDRTMFEGIAKDIYPEYNLTAATEKMPTEYYQNGINGEGGIVKGMSFKALVDIYGLPYDAGLSGFVAGLYRTSDGKTVTVYFDGNFAVDSVMFLD